MKPRGRTPGGRQDQSAVPQKQAIGFKVASSPTNSPPLSRLQWALHAAIGSRVEVTTVDGEKYEGIYMDGSRHEQEWSVTLADVKPARDGPDQDASDRARVATRTFPGRELAHVVAKDVKLQGSSDPAANGSAQFGTDTEISRRNRNDLFGRELQKWEPDAGGMSLEDLSLDRHQPDDRPWDQFEANQRQYGVQTTFNEEMYTTKLDKSQARISEREAARIAAEIEGKRTTNFHQAEERGQISYRELDEDEEARYSSVHRTAAPGAGPTGRASEPGSRENGKKAWSSAAGSVAAVSGRPGRSSAPVDVDPRKEHNKLRMQLTGKPVAGSKDRSPYGTPKSTRALVSPLVGDASQVEALDLNPGTAKFDRMTRSDFARFKKASRQEPPGQAEPEPEPANPKDAPPAGPVGNMRPQLAQQPGRDGPPPEHPPQHVPAGGARPQLGPHGWDPAAARPLAAQCPGSQQVPLVTMTPATGPARPQTGPPRGAPAAERPAERPSTSKLNPDAKEFKFNPGARVFVPSAPTLSRAASAASSIASITPAGQTAMGRPPASPKSSLPSRASSSRLSERKLSRELGKGQAGSPSQQSSRMARPYPPAVQMGMSPMMGQQGMVAPHIVPPGQQRFVPGAQGYPVPMMQPGAGPVYVGGGQPMMQYVAFSPPGGPGYPQQGYAMGMYPPANMQMAVLPHQQGYDRQRGDGRS